MRVIIAGSRTITDGTEVAQAAFASRFEFTEIVSGTAKGVDRLGEWFAAHRGIPIKRFPADWDKYGKSAGYKRNKQMAEYADALILLIRDNSKGSIHMFNLAIKHDLEVYCVEYVSDSSSKGYSRTKVKTFNSNKTNEPKIT